MSNIKIYSPSVREWFFDELKDSVKPYECCFVNGKDTTCFSNLLNNIIVNSDSDIVIISNDKARPKPSDVDKMLSLIDNGYGFVCLYRLGFFGFHKDLIKKVGFFDERFVKAGCEDNDMFLRLRFCNISSYISEEINYLDKVPSMWEHSASERFFYKKYLFDKKNNIINKVIGEETYSYDIKCCSKNFKDWSHSYLSKDALRKMFTHFYYYLTTFKMIDSSKS